MSQQQGQQESPQAGPKAVEKVGKQSMGTPAPERGLPGPSDQDTAAYRCGSVTGSTTRHGDIGPAPQPHPGRPLTAMGLCSVSKAGLGQPLRQIPPNTLQRQPLITQHHHLSSPRPVASHRDLEVGPGVDPFIHTGYPPEQAGFSRCSDSPAPLTAWVT